MVETRHVEFRIDVARLERVFKCLIEGDKGNYQSEVDTVYMSAVLAEVCWRLMADNLSGYVGNIGEFRSEMKLAVFKYVEDCWKH